MGKIAKKKRGVIKIQTFVFNRFQNIINSLLAFELSQASMKQ